MKKQPEEKQKKKKKNKFPIEHMQNAIVDSKWTVPIGQDVVILRYDSGKEYQAVCNVKDVSEDGKVGTFDTTKEQWFFFSVEEAIKHNLVIKKIM